MENAQTNSILESSIDATHICIEETRKARQEKESMFISDYKMGSDGFLAYRLKQPEMANQLTVDDWLENTGLNWMVETSPVMYEYRGLPKIDNDSKVIYCSDNGERLGIAGKDFAIVQNHEILGFFEQYAESLGSSITEVGVCDGGKKVYAYIDLESQVNLVGQESGSKRVLLMDSRDGSMSVTAIPFFERFICFNQIRPAVAKFGASRRKHSKHFSLSLTANDLGLYQNIFDQQIETMNTMSQTSLSNGEALQLIYNQYSKPDKPVKEQPTRTLNQMLAIYDKFAGGGIGMVEPETNGTVYGLLNSVLEYYDHDHGRTENSRFKSNVSGTGAQQKASTFSALENLLDSQESLHVDEHVVEHVLSCR